MIYFELSALKDTINRVKKQTTGQNKIFADHISNKDIYPKYIKNSDNLTKQKNPLKLGKGLEQIFLQRNTNDNKHKKRCSTSLITREMQVKIAIRY